MYRRGASGHLTQIVKGKGLRVHTIVLELTAWQMSPASLCEEYDLTLEQVQGPLAFFEVEQGEIEMSLAEEQQIELAT